MSSRRDCSTGRISLSMLRYMKSGQEGRTDAQVGVDGGITSGSGQVLVLPIRDVEVGLGVTVFLGQTEIDDIDLVAALADAHEEVIRFDITVDEGLGVDVLDAGDELIGQQKNGLQGELAVAEVEEILQAGAEEIQRTNGIPTPPASDL